MKKIYLVLGILSIMALQLQAKQDYWVGEEYCANSSSQKNAAAELMHYVQIKENDHILDVGCGDGKITAEIAAKIPKGSIVGTDISPAMIEFATTKFPQESFSNLSFMLKDAQNLDYDEQFEIIFSFTALHWVLDHDAFLKGANKSLKPSGILAFSMPIGIPPTLIQAANELISSPKWASYFHAFSTGWNFTDHAQCAKLLASNGFAAVRLAAVLQKDIFASREIFEGYTAQWFPYLRPLPQDLKQTFLTQVVDRYLELESLPPNGEVHFNMPRLEVIANKIGL